MTHNRPDRKILIAVDFGTTFSGLAWAQTRKPELQTPVIQWPDATSGGLEGITSDKVPTEIQYDGQNYKWGFQIAEYGQRHQWFKLGLDSSQTRGNSQLAVRFPDPQAAPPGYNTPPEKLATDYLTALRKHAEQTLRYKLPQSALVDTPIEYVITVPAVWSDSAQAKTRACAEQAGMGTGSALHIISEPEAAAMYALDAMDPHNIKVGDTFVLCDAGGGTVDLISYTVSALKPILRVAEASPGSGHLCGSSFLNRIFEKFITEKLGLEREWDEEVLEEAMKRFDIVIKRQFRGIAGEEFMIPVPGLRDNASLGVRRGRFAVTGNEIKEIFEPVVQEVLLLIEGQIKAVKMPVKAVLLVGGFGQNAYLRDRIRQKIGNVEVMQSPNGWTAIVRGALMKGLISTSPAFATVGISSRCARKYYGTESDKDYIEGMHDVSRRHWCEYSGEWKIGTMDWFMKKGDRVQEDKPFELVYHKIRLVSHGPPTSVIVSLQCFPDPDNVGAPIYGSSPGIIQLVNVKADLRRISESRFRRVRGDNGNQYYLVEFQIQITYFSAYTKYELIHDGTNSGAVAAEYV